MPRPAICYGMAYRLFRAVSEITGVPYNRLLIALRGELGELKGRFHFHALVGGTTARNLITLSHQLERQWRIISGNAIPQVRPYDRTLAGADYVCKCLGANRFELSKYNLADEVTLSHSVLAVIRAMDAKGDRRHGELTRKNGQVMKAAGDNGQGVPGASNLCDETASSGSGMVA